MNPSAPLINIYIDIVEFGVLRRISVNTHTTTVDKLLDKISHIISSCDVCTYTCPRKYSLWAGSDKCSGFTRLNNKDTLEECGVTHETYLKAVVIEDELQQ